MLVGKIIHMNPRKSRVILKKSPQNKKQDANELELHELLEATGQDKANLTIYGAAECVPHRIILSHSTTARPLGPSMLFVLRTLLLFRFFAN
jgi:hypothetical protein